MHTVLAGVTSRLVERSRTSRTAYLSSVAQATAPARGTLACGNLAHAAAACAPGDRSALLGSDAPGIGIVTAYNDLLSAHQPFEAYPAVIRAAVTAVGGVAQVAGGVPAMCDGITQGRAGMDLSLLSRDVIALSTALALAHDVFDGAVLLGVCDKIVPGLLIGALAFGHLPMALVPAGPMPSGLPNGEKGAVRRAHAAGTATREELLRAEVASYHAPGTCTFYGTANSNQVLMEAMGLHLPGASFVAPGTAVREALTRRAAEQVVANARAGTGRLADIVDERSLLNGVVALLATGGSTNHTMHLVAIAAAAGIDLRWEDFDALSAVVPLLARIYPNGPADVNAFADAGGVPFVLRELCGAGLLHEDVTTVVGSGLAAYAQAPVLSEGILGWQPAPAVSGDPDVVRPASSPFQADGGLRLLRGNLGEAVVKVSAVPAERRVVEAPAAVFASQEEVLVAFSERRLDRDVVVVLRHQGPRANGMPELHQLTPSLTVLLRRGHRVALVTDGRMSGASGELLAALHVTPEAALDGGLARVRDGDVVRVDALTGTLDVLVPELELRARSAAGPATGDWTGTGRELFGPLRAMSLPASAGGGVLTGVRA